MCRKHPYAETIGAACPYCRLVRLLKDAKKRPALGARPLTSDSLHSYWQDEYEARLGLRREERLKEEVSC